MLKVNTLEVSGFKGAILGMRNPLNSRSKCDSDFNNLKLGEKDLDLCKRLIKSGPDHRKFLRMIHVQADIVAPLYLYKELDTYKVSTVCNSSSTMHTIHRKEFAIEDFSIDHLLSLDSMKNLIDILNAYREKYIETKEKQYWWQMIQLLPSSYNQLRTLDFNYETLMNVYKSRKDHKLDEWHVFCDWIRGLPYMNEFLEYYL